jgi:hypothetical protein
MPSGYNGQPDGLHVSILHGGVSAEPHRPRINRAAVMDQPRVQHKSARVWKDLHALDEWYSYAYTALRMSVRAASIISFHRRAFACALQICQIIVENGNPSGQHSTFNSLVVARFRLSIQGIVVLRRRLGVAFMIAVC